MNYLNQKRTFTYLDKDFHYTLGFLNQKIHLLYNHYRQILVQDYHRHGIYLGFLPHSLPDTLARNSTHPNHHLLFYKIFT